MNFVEPSAGRRTHDMFVGNPPMATPADYYNKSRTRAHFKSLAARR